MNDMDKDERRKHNTAILEKIMMLSEPMTMGELYEKWLTVCAEEGQLSFDEIPKLMESQREYYEEYTEPVSLPDDYVPKYTDIQAFPVHSQEFTFFTRLSRAFNLFIPSKQKGRKSPLLSRPSVKKNWKIQAESALKTGLNEINKQDPDFVNAIISFFSDQNTVASLRKFKEYKVRMQNKKKNLINAEIFRNSLTIINDAFGSLSNKKTVLEYAHAFYIKTIEQYLAKFNPTTDSKQTAMNLLKIIGFTQKYASYYDSFIKRKLKLKSYSNISYPMFGTDLYHTLRNQTHWLDLNKMVKGKQVQNASTYNNDWLKQMIFSALMYPVQNPPQNIQTILKPNNSMTPNSQTKEELILEFTKVLDDKPYWNQAVGGSGQNEILFKERSAKKALGFLKIIEDELHSVLQQTQRTIFPGTEALMESMLFISRSVIQSKVSNGRIPKKVYTSIFSAFLNISEYLEEVRSESIARPVFTFNLDPTQTNHIAPYLSDLKSKITQIASKRQKSTAFKLFKREDHRLLAFNCVIERIAGQLSFMKNLDITDVNIRSKVSMLYKKFNDSMLQYLRYFDPTHQTKITDPINDLKSFLFGGSLQRYTANVHKDLQSKIKLIVTRLTNLAKLYIAVRDCQCTSNTHQTAPYSEKCIFYTAYVLSSVQQMLSGKVLDILRLRNIERPPVDAKVNPRNIQTFRKQSVNPDQCQFSKLRNSRYFISEDSSYDFLTEHLIPTTDEEGARVILYQIRETQRQIREMLDGNRSYSDVDYPIRRNIADSVNKSVNELKEKVQYLKDLHFHFFCTKDIKRLELLLSDSYADASKEIRSYLRNMTETGSAESWMEKILDMQNLERFFSIYQQNDELGNPNDLMEFSPYLNLILELESYAKGKSSGKIAGATILKLYKNTENAEKLMEIIQELPKSSKPGKIFNKQFNNKFPDDAVEIFTRELEQFLNDPSDNSINSSTYFNLINSVFEYAGTKADHENILRYIESATDEDKIITEIESNLSKRTKAYAYFKDTFKEKFPKTAQKYMKRALEIYRRYQLYRSEPIEMNVSYNGRILSPRTQGSYEAHQIHLFKPDGADYYEMINLIRIPIVFNANDYESLIGQQNKENFVVSTYFKIKPNTSTGNLGVFQEIIDEIKLLGIKKNEPGGTHYLFKNYNLTYGDGKSGSTDRLFSKFQFVLGDGGRLNLRILTKKPIGRAKNTDSGYKIQIGSDPGLRKHSITARTIEEVPPPYGIDKDKVWSDVFSPTVAEYSFGNSTGHNGIQNLVDKANANIRNYKDKIERIRDSSRELQREIDNTLNITTLGSSRNWQHIEVKRKIRRLLRKMVLHKSSQAKIQNLHNTVSREIYSSTKQIVELAKAIYSSDHNIPIDAIKAIIPLEDNRSLKGDKGSKKFKRAVSEMERGESRKLIQNYYQGTNDLCWPGSARYSSRRCATCGCSAEKGYIFKLEKKLKFERSAGGNFVKCTNPDCSSKILFDKLLNLTSRNKKFRTLSDAKLDPDELMNTGDQDLRKAGFYLCRDRNASQNFARYIRSQPQLYVQLRILSYYVLRNEKDKISKLKTAINASIKDIMLRIEDSAIPDTIKNRYLGILTNTYQKIEKYVSKPAQPPHFTAEEIFLRLASFDPP